MLPSENRYRLLFGVLARVLCVMGCQTHRIGVLAAILLAVPALTLSGFSQTTVSTGGIQGTVTDPSGALVSGAKVSLTNVQDPVPGTHVGEFDRGINASNINRVIENYNARVASRPTSAGQVLIQEGLVTSAQLTALGAVAPALPNAPPNQANLGWLRVFDATMSWTYSIKERVAVKPSVGFYNMFNFANFDLPTSSMSGLLAGTAGTINGTDPVAHNTNRVGVGTGVFTLGSPREIEFSLRIIF